MNDFNETQEWAENVIALRIISNKLSQEERDALARFNDLIKHRDTLRSQLADIDTELIRLELRLGL